MGAICAYCARATGIEEDHVVARQFFPNEEKFRAGLPKVPCCADCNRAKQRVEDGPAVWFQFGDASEGSSAVLERRVPRTLAKNKRLARELREKTREVWAFDPSGLLVRRLALRLGARELRDSHQWFRFLFRGLFCFETGQCLPPDNEVFLVWPNTERRYRFVLDMLLGIQDHSARSFAQGELRYVFAINQNLELSYWLLSFRSIQMAGITIGRNCPSLLRSALAAVAWTQTE
jgi:hypothetical protein